MQRRGLRVDLIGMRILGLWLLVIAGVALGFQIASPTSANAEAAATFDPRWVGVFLTSTALALGIASRRGKGCHLWFASALALLGLARGMSSASDPAPTEADRRGRASHTRLLSIEGASTPGPRCRVSARTARGGQVELALPADACPLWWGDLIRVPSEALHTDAGRQTPDQHGPIAVPHAWRVRPPDASRPSTLRTLRMLASSSVARARQAGWDAARGDPARGFVVSSSLGLSGALPPGDRVRLRRAGLGHLVAVSGLHVGLAAVTWLVLLRWSLARWWWGAPVAVAVSMLPVCVYVALTGAAPPAVRAALMFALVALGSVRGRPTHRLSVVAVAVALMVFVHPHWLVQPSFQLSVAAMVVLVRLPPGAGASLTSWQLGWALLPLLWLHFDASSDGSVVANAVAVPIFALWVVPLAIVGWGLLPLLGGVALDPAAAGARVILDVAERIATWPEIPRWVWICGAVLAWVPGVRARISERAHAWLPHRGASAVLLVVAGVSWWPRTPRTGWTAWSTRRGAEVLSVRSDGTACVRAPTSSARRWRARLDQHAVRTLSGVQRSAKATVSDPALLEWREGLGALARDVPRGLPSCALPQPEIVREALDRCRAFSSTPSAHMRTDASLQCWSARLGAWQPAPIHSR